MSYQPIEDKLYQRLNKKHEEDIKGRIPQMRDSQVYDYLPDKDPFEDQNAIRVIKGKIGIPDQEIANSLNRLIEKGKLVTSRAIKTNKLYLRKNPY